MQCYGEWSSQMTKDGRKVGRQQKTTLFQKTTHFEFGSDPPNLQSEMSHSFSDQMTVEGQPSSIGLNKSRSNLFRAEDIVRDNAEERERFVSVQKKDYANTQPAGLSSTTSVGYSHVLPRSVELCSTTAEIRALARTNLN